MIKTQKNNKRLELTVKDLKNVKGGATPSFNEKDFSQRAISTDTWACW